MSTLKVDTISPQSSWAAGEIAGNRTSTLSALVLGHGGEFSYDGAGTVAHPGTEYVLDVTNSTVVEYWLVGAGAPGGYHTGGGGGAGAVVHDYLDVTGVNQLTLVCASSSKSNTNIYTGGTSCIRGYVSAGGGTGTGSGSTSPAGDDLGGDGGVVTFSDTYPGNTKYVAQASGDKGSPHAFDDQTGGAGAPAPGSKIGMAYGTALHHENTGNSGSGAGASGDPHPVGAGAGGHGGMNYGQGDKFKNGSGQGQHGAGGFVVVVYNA